MNNLTLEKNINRALTISILFFAIYPLIPKKIEGLTVILFGVISFLIFLQLYRTKRILKNEFLITSSIFFAFLISAFLSEDIGSAFTKIETMLSLIIIPLSFYVFLGKKSIDITKYKNLFFRIYFTANILYSLLLIIFFTRYINPRYPTKDVNFFRNAVQDIPLIGEHPIYSSIFLSIAVLIGITLYKKGNKTFKHNLIISLGHILMLVVLFLLMSKGVIIALLFSTLILLSNKINKKRIYLVILSGFVILLLLIPASNNRFNKLFNKMTYETIDMHNSTSIRIHIMKCALDLLIKNPVIGYGLGDVQNELNNCYEQNKMNFPKDYFNSHNQYLFVWLSAGILGLLIFLIFLGFYFKIAITNKDHLMLSIIMLYSIVFLFENVLSRQSGVIFFAFLMNFMAYGKQIQVRHEEINYYTNSNP